MLAEVNFKSIICTIAVGLTVSFNACSEQSPFHPTEDETLTEETSLAKGRKPKKSDENRDKQKDKNNNSLSFPISASKTFRFHRGEGYYRGGDIEFPDGNKSKFSLQDGALTPPPDVKFGQPVTITMEVDFNETTNELIYTFGPHGCQFDPPALVKLDYGALGIDVPVLYYIDQNGKYIRQKPDDINVNRKWLMIWVDHFSRYAVSWGGQGRLKR